MLERSANQATGLLTLASPRGPRLISMVNHGDEKFELPLLWRLCSTLVGLGYSVTVLDATTCESDANPGLEQLLEYDFWGSDITANSLDWKVIPSAFGLQSLGAMQERKEQSLQHLGQLFPHEGVLILYGKAQWLVPLLSHSGIKPLLAVAPVQNSLLSSYVALKHLLLNGRLEPTIVNLVQDLPSAGSARLRAIATTLSDCAKNFLGYDVNALNISAPFDEDSPSADMQHVALRMLEYGLPLSQASSTTPPHTAHAGLGHFTGSH